MSGIRTYFIEATASSQPASSETTSARNSHFVIALHIEGTEDGRAIADELMAVRRNYPGHHVGLWLTNTSLPSSARHALEYMTGADFAESCADIPSLDIIRQCLLDLARLPRLADLWISSQFPRLSDTARVFFSHAHDLVNARHRVTESAQYLGLSDRTLRRHLNPLASPADILALGRMVAFAVNAARSPDRSLMDHAADFGLFDYRSLSRRFKRYFGRPPAFARTIVDPADLWHAWSETHVAVLS